MTKAEALKFIKKQTEKVIKLTPYKIDVEVDKTDKADEVKVTLHRTKLIKTIRIDCIVKEKE